MWKTDLPSRTKKTDTFFLNRGFLIGVAIACMVTSFAVLGFGLFESFFGGGNIHSLRLPGFQEVKLNSAGLYAGVYQHRGTTPVPVKALSSLDIRVMSKNDYEAVPVLMNNSGQTFERMGFQGYPLFNFQISEPGAYTVSGVSTGDAGTQNFQILLIPQSAGNIRQNLIVSVTFFLFFLGMGTLMLFRLDRWAPKKIP